MKKITIFMMMLSMLTLLLSTALSFAADKLIVEDLLGNPVFTVSDTGQVFAAKSGFGTSDPQASLHLVENSSKWDRGLITQQFNNNAAAAVVQFKRARGTVATPLPVQNGDALAGIHAYPWDGISYNLTGSILYKIDGPVSQGVTPTSISIFTGTTYPHSERLKIASDGLVTISDLAGPHENGSAYVCVDDNGALFIDEIGCP